MVIRVNTTLETQKITLNKKEKNMKEITNINHIGMRLREFKTSQEFYEKLGFDFIEGPIGPEPVQE